MRVPRRKRAKAASEKKWPVPQAIWLLLVGALFYYVLWPWMRVFDLGNSWLAYSALVSAGIWLLVLFWALYHLVFQIGSLVKPVANLSRHSRGAGEISFTILYVTRDDFEERACQTCVDQPGRHRVLICDDSERSEYRDGIDRFAEDHPHVQVVRRDNLQAFKAGNLNHAIGNHTSEDEEWMLIVDADQHLPAGYLAAMCRLVGHLPASVAFVQARNKSDHLRQHEETRSSEAPATEFQRAMGHEVDLHYKCTLPWREKCGFQPMMGHGVAIRRSAWKLVGGFPELVSEDFAFAALAASHGLRGTYAEEPSCWESYPKDFGAFVTRLLKFAQGAGELLWYASRKIPRRLSWVEKIDLLMLLLCYPLMPLIVANGFLSAYVCHRLWSYSVSPLHPLLANLFLGMWLCTICLGLGVNPTLRAALRHWFWATAVYTASMPIAAYTFVKHILVKPSFDRTPKGLEQSPDVVRWNRYVVPLGAITIALSLYWMSPFTPFLAATGVSYACFPLYGSLHEDRPRGRLARRIVFLPGALLLVALFWMWWWAAPFGTFLGFQGDL